MGHEYDQGVLSEVGRLARHVRSRDQGEARSVAVEAVAHELALLEELLDDGMPSILDDELTTFQNLWPRVAIQGGDFRKALHDVQPAEEEVAEETPAEEVAEEPAAEAEAEAPAEETPAEE